MNDNQGELRLATEADKKKDMARQDKQTLKNFKLRLKKDKSGFIILECKNRKGEEIVIPDAFKGKPILEIAASAFFKCSCSSIAIPDSVLLIETGAFYMKEGKHLKYVSVDEGNVNYQSIDGVLYSKDGKNLFLYPKGKEDAFFAIPKGVEKIARGAFSGCCKLINLSFPDSIKEIEDYAFYHCNGLTSVIIANTVREIGKGAFQECQNLEVVKILGTPSIGGMAFYRLRSLKHLTTCSLNITEYLFPIDFRETLETLHLTCGWVEGFTFSRCEKLRSLTLGVSVQSIDKAFSSCVALTEIRYLGTREEWRKVSKGVDCWRNVPAREVDCLDGKIPR